MSIPVLAQVSKNAFLTIIILAALILFLIAVFGPLSGKFDYAFGWILWNL